MNYKLQDVSRQIFLAGEETEDIGVSAFSSLMFIF